MNIEKLNIQDAEAVAFVENLYLESFPKDERRPVKEFFELHLKHPLFTILLVCDDTDKPLGFLSYWDFEAFIYAEHFAISSVCRNSGLGRQSMEYFAQIHTKPVILEVETPNDDLSKRRVGFYERLGFRLWQSVPYIQPAYRIGGNAVPMLLMSLGEIEVDKEIDNIKNIIYANVYNQTIDLK